MRATDGPSAAVIIVGDEVLAGKVDDANGPFLARALRARGVRLAELRVVADVVDDIAAAVRALRRHDHVFTTGGVGPTHDDVTIAGVAAAVGRPVVRHPQLLELLAAGHDHDPDDARLKMAEVPEGAAVHLGDGDIVPVVQFDNVAVLPGVPALMRACFAHLAPRLRGPPFVSHALLLGVGESAIAHALRAVQALHGDVQVGSYPRFDRGAYRVKLTVDGRDSAHVAACVAAIRAFLRPGWLVGEECANL